jgi:hypothetical protein
VSRPPATFESALDDLDPEERTSFVAAVYDARGWVSERVGTAVSVRPPGDGADQRRVAPPGVATVDRVTTLSYEELRGMLRYAISSDDRTRLCRRFFDRPPESVGLTGSPARAPDDARHDADGSESQRSRSGAPTVESPDDEGTDNARGRSSDPPDETAPEAPEADGNGDRFSVPPLPVFVVALALALVLAAAVVAALFTAWPVVPTPDSAEPGPATETPGVENTSVTASPPAADDETATADGSSGASGESVEDSAWGRQIVLEASYPPGVGVDGVENVSTLAAAHRSTLSNRSYRLSVTSRESVDGTPTAVAWERTVVETAARHRSTVRVAGAFRWPPSGVANASTYANGTTRVVRTGANTDADGNVRFESSAAETRSPSGPGHRVVGPAPDTDPFAPRTASVLRGTLAGSDTAVTGSFERGGLRYFWIDVRDTSAASRVDAGTLLVDERGLVHEMRYARTTISLDSTLVRRIVTVRITPGNVTLVPPPWYRSTEEADRRSSLSSAGSDPRLGSRYARLTGRVRGTAYRHGERGGPAWGARRVAATGGGGSTFDPPNSDTASRHPSADSRDPQPDRRPGRLSW